MKNGRVKQVADKLVAGLMTAAVSATFVSGLLGGGTVLAAETKNQNNTSLGTAGISNPNAPSSDSNWSGNYVYFGTNRGSSIKFRVLEKDSTTFSSGKTLFLDCDSTLFTHTFDAGSKSWSSSELKDYLNDTFIRVSFTDIEKDALASSYRSSHNLTVGTKAGNVSEWTQKGFKSYVALTGEKVFVLDAEEASNVAYGYSTEDTKSKNRVKDGTSRFWWLRSDYQPNDNSCGYITFNGQLRTYQIDNKIGVSPAFNVDQNEIIFSTSLASASNEFKLTLNDSDMSVAVTSGKKITAEGSKVTVPYSITGANAGNATRVSVLILDKEYKTGNSGNAKILFYDGLSGTFDKTSSGSFTLPSSLNFNDWGTKYFVYILAEDINGSNVTDYASEPVKISAPSNSAGPTSKPTVTPTKKPTATPTPTKKPTATPTPTKKPTATPTPTKKPTATPTKKPTVTPTKKPTVTPTKKPTATPTVKPTVRPTTKPTVTPTNKPTATPTKKPTVTPTKKPTATPTKKPTVTPTAKPTTKPTVTPTPSPKPKSTWVKEGGNWYYYDANGNKATGWIKDGTSWYYCDSNGVMQKGWIQDGASWYYLGASGAMAKGWVKVGTTWYYLGASGAMATGWIKVGNTWYYLTNSGAMVTGWCKVGTKWYYFDENGAMKTGWHQSGKNWYYLNPATGEMVTGKVTIDGKTSNFDASGVWLGYV